MMISKKLLIKYAKDNGFHEAYIISTNHIQKILKQIKGKYRFDVSRIKKHFLDYFRINLFSDDSSFTFLICGLSCYRDERKGQYIQNSDHGALAMFAQRNYYTEAVHKLKTVVKEIQKKTGIKKNQARIFCNSGAPEKFLAWAGGLGVYGNNSLIINKILGSEFIIAGLLLLFPIKNFPEIFIPNPPGAFCGLCHRCLDACPTHAIKEPGCIDQSLCIQALSTRLINIPGNIKKAFSNRIYGCEVCQEVCLYNQELMLETNNVRGELGPSISLNTILQKSPGELSMYFKKTVPGSSWIDMRAIQRNALLAAGNLKCRSLLPLIIPYLKDHHPALMDAAAWAVDKINE